MQNVYLFTLQTINHQFVSCCNSNNKWCEIVFVSVESICSAIKVIVADLFVFRVNGWWCVCVWVEGGRAWAGGELGMHFTTDNICDIRLTYKWRGFALTDLVLCSSMNKNVFKVTYIFYYCTSWYIAPHCLCLASSAHQSC